MDKQKKVRPVSVRIDDFKRDLSLAVERAELPAYILEILIGQYLAGVKEVAREEYAEERAEWEAPLPEMEGS